MATKIGFLVCAEDYGYQEKWAVCDSKEQADEFIEWCQDNGHSSAFGGELYSLEILVASEEDSPSDIYRAFRELQESRLRSNA